MKLPAGIRQRGEGFRVDVTYNGVRKTATVATIEQAVAKQSELRAELITSTGGEEGHATWTLQQAYERTCRDAWADCKAKDDLQANARIALQFFGPATPVSTITADKIYDFMEHLKNTGYMNGTINRKVAALTKMLGHAVACNRLRAQPKIKRKKEIGGRIRFYTQQEEQAILHTFDQWGKDDHSEATCVLLDTGVRPDELWHLEPRDVDFETGIISVWLNKNDNPRSVPMTSRVRSILKRRIECGYGKGGRPIFPHDNYWMNDAWERMRTHLEMDHDKQFIPYVCRHTCASRLIQRGVSLKVVQEWLGHKSITTTMKYAHLAPNNFNDAVKVLEQL